MNINLLAPLGVALAQLPEIILTLFALAALLVAAWRHRTAEDSRLAGWVSLAGTGVAFAAMAWLWTMHARPMDGAHMVALDNFRFAAGLLILLATAGTILLSLAYTVREGLTAPEYYPLILFAASGMFSSSGGAPCPGNIASLRDWILPATSTLQTSCSYGARHMLKSLSPWEGVIYPGQGPE